MKFRRSIQILLVLAVLFGGYWLYNGGELNNNSNPLSQEEAYKQNPGIKQKAKNFVNKLSGNDNSQVSNKIATNIGGLTKKQYTYLANLDFKSGSKPFAYVNNNQSTLNINSWKRNEVLYHNLDSLNRTSMPNIGFLEKRNVANDSLRVRQYIQPTGWHWNHVRNQIYNRGHMIAYSVSKGIGQSGKYNPSERSGDQNNPKNLFTQTAFSNQDVQTIWESKVRKALRNNQKVIYEATPIFRGNELMARGINLQAISTGGLNFNVYLFNIQPGYTFNYQNGHAQKSNLKVDWSYRYGE